MKHPSIFNVFFDLHNDISVEYHVTAKSIILLASQEVDFGESYYPAPIPIQFP